MTPPVEGSSLSAEHLEAWAALATLLERLPMALDTQLQRDSDMMHFEHGLLFALASAPEHTLRMSVLAGYASSTLSRLSRAVSRLEKKGWVRRIIDPTDGRFTLAVLTEKGNAQLAESTPAHHALVEELVFGSLTDAQVRQLAEISRRIATTIDPTAPWTPSAD